MTTPKTPEVSVKEQQKIAMRKARDESLTVITGEYQTHHEIEFIAGLSWHSALGLSRQVLLERYLVGIKGRTNWGKMNKKEVFAAATEALKHA